jgi:hypothetical protein
MPADATMAYPAVGRFKCCAGQRDYYEKRMWASWQVDGNEIVGRVYFHETYQQAAKCFDALKPGIDIANNKQERRI